MALLLNKMITTISNILLILIVIFSIIAAVFTYKCQTHKNNNNKIDVDNTFCLVPIQTLRQLYILHKVFKERSTFKDTKPLFQNLKRQKKLTHNNLQIYAYIRYNGVIDIGTYDTNTRYNNVKIIKFSTIYTQHYNEYELVGNDIIDWLKK